VTGGGGGRAIDWQRLHPLSPLVRVGRGLLPLVVLGGLSASRGGHHASAQYLVWFAVAALGAVLPARGTVELGFDVTPPAWVEPGQWWALIRIGCAGRLVYSPSVKVVVQ